MAHQRALAHYPDPVPRRCAGGRARRGARRRVGQARARPEPPAAGGGMIAKPASIASRHRDTGSSYPVSLAPRKGGSPLPAPPTQRSPHHPILLRRCTGLTCAFSVDVSSANGLQIVCLSTSRARANVPYGRNRHICHCPRRPLGGGGGGFKGRQTKTGPGQTRAKRNKNKRKKK